MNSAISELQFGFRQKYSTSYALIHLTDKIREQLDSGNLQKAFATVDHDIRIQKLNQVEISKLEHILCGVPQGSILGPLLFLI